MMKFEHYNELMDMIVKYGNECAAQDEEAINTFADLRDTLLAFCMECVYQQELATTMKIALKRGADNEQD